MVTLEVAANRSQCIQLNDMARCICKKKECKTPNGLTLQKYFSVPY